MTLGRFNLDEEIHKLLNPPTQVPVMPRLLNFLRGMEKLKAPRTVPLEQTLSKRAPRGIGFMGTRAPRKRFPFLGEIR